MEGTTGPLLLNEIATKVLHFSFLWNLFLALESVAENPNFHRYLEWHFHDSGLTCSADEGLKNHPVKSTGWKTLNTYSTFGIGHFIMLSVPRRVRLHSSTSSAFYLRPHLAQICCLEPSSLISRHFGTSSALCRGKCMISIPLHFGITNTTIRHWYHYFSKCILALGGISIQQKEWSQLPNICSLWIFLPVRQQIILLPTTHSLYGTTVTSTTDLVTAVQ